MNWSQKDFLRSSTNRRASNTSGPQTTSLLGARALWPASRSAGQRCTALVDWCVFAASAGMRRHQNTPLLLVPAPDLQGSGQGASQNKSGRLLAGPGSV